MHRNRYLRAWILLYALIFFAMSWSSGGVNAEATYTPIPPNATPSEAFVKVEQSAVLIVQGVGLPDVTNVVRVDQCYKGTCPKYLLVALPADSPTDPMYVPTGVPLQSYLNRESVLLFLGEPIQNIYPILLMVNPDPAYVRWITKLEKVETPLPTPTAGPSNSPLERIDGQWLINGNGYMGTLFFHTNSDGDLMPDSYYMEGRSRARIIGFWDATAKKLTFIRLLGSAPETYQIFTGYLMGAGQWLAGSFDAFRGTGAVPRRVTYGWFASRQNS